MAKAFYVVKDIDNEGGSPRILYKVIAPGSRIPEYGCDFKLDMTKTLQENLTALTDKVAFQVDSHGLKVTAADIDPIGTEKVLESQDAQPKGFLASTWDSLKNMVSG